MGEVPPSLNQDVASFRLQGITIGLLLTLEVRTKVLLVAEASRGFVLVDEVRRVLICDQLELLTEPPVTLANVVGAHGR